MISSSLLDLLGNRYVLGGLAGLLGLIVAYFKGSSAAKRAAELERLEAEKAQSSKLRAAEAKNLWLEKRGAKKNESINSTSTIDDLIGMWNEINSKDERGPSDKKS